MSAFTLCFLVGLLAFCLRLLWEIWGSDGSTPWIILIGVLALLIMYPIASDIARRAGDRWTRYRDTRAKHQHVSAVNAHSERFNPVLLHRYRRAQEAVVLLRSQHAQLTEQLRHTISADSQTMMSAEINKVEGQLKLLTQLETEIRQLMERSYLAAQLNDARLERSSLSISTNRPSLAELTAEISLQSLIEASP